MSLRRLIVYNYKSLKYFDQVFSKDCNIIVGNNECGKSTILEAINLVFTGQLNGNNIAFELSPFLFNSQVVSDYIESLMQGQNPNPPYILIEAYLYDSPEIASLRGSINKQKEDAVGLSICIRYNNEYADEYAKYIADPFKVATIPIEYYEVKSYSFAQKAISYRGLPISSTLIDTSENRRKGGTDQYVSKIINDFLEPKDRASLALSFRKLKHTFATADGMTEINNQLKSRKGEVTDKELSVSIDISPKTNWDASLATYLNDIPFQYVGKGEQNSIKMKLALESKAKDSTLILIEEPENHLSFANMSKLIRKISEKCSGRQLILTTHSNYVLNKLGLENVILVGPNQRTSLLTTLDADTQDYFKKLPGYDTLRLLLSDKPILVEGPSDELIIQRAYLDEYDMLPIDDGVDIISVRSLAFKRFLDVAKAINKEIHVVTDNDGSIYNLQKRYTEYLKDKNIHFHFDNDEVAYTLEAQIVKFNELTDLNNILGRNFSSKEDLEKFMTDNKNKTECALKIFESEQKITMPPYVLDAIKK